MKETLAKFHSFLIESEGLNIEIAREAIENEGYEYVEKGNVLKVLDDNRDDALNKLTSVLGRLGFTHNPIIGGSLGRLEMIKYAATSIFCLSLRAASAPPQRALISKIAWRPRLATWAWRQQRLAMDTDQTSPLLAPTKPSQPK